jgi:hypothetical protein
MTPLDTALDYIARGWNPVPIPLRSKKPVDNAWQTRLIDAASAPQFFNSGSQNVGVGMGPASNGLSDVDLDAAEALDIGPYLLPATASIFGRPSKRFSHRLYYTDLATTHDGAAVQFRAPDGTMLVELRIGGGGKGAQTVFPGSVHENGERITWDQDGEPAKMAGDELLAKVKLVAAATLIARCWPAEGGRHDAARCLGGLLARVGFSEEPIKLVTQATARAAHDGEWKDRVTAARDAAREYHQGGRAYGMPKLIEIIGKPATKRVAEWLGYDTRAERGPFERGKQDTDEAREQNRGNDSNKPHSFGPWRYHTGEAPEPPRWLIKYLLPETGVALIAGQWGTYKTTVALDAALSVMTGLSFAGRYRVKRQGGVLYVALEGQGGLMARLAALAAYRELEGPFPFAWRSDCPALTDPDAADILCTLAADATTELKAKFGVPVVLIIIDTMVTAAQYNEGKEDDSGATLKVIAALRKVSGHTGALAVGIDHFGKVIESGTRGSSVKETNPETVLALIAERELGGLLKDTKLAVRKQRDGISGDEISFTPQKIETGTDEDGDPITAPVIDWQKDTGPIGTTKAKDGWTTASLKLLRRAVVNVLDCGRDCHPLPDMPVVRAIDVEIVRAEFCKIKVAHGGDKKTQDAAKRQAWSRVTEAAQARNLIGVREVDDKMLMWLVTVPPTQ